MAIVWIHHKMQSIDQETNSVARPIDIDSTNDGISIVESEQSNNTYQICLFGAMTDVPNLGCRALTSSLVGIINSVKPNSQIKLLFGNQTGGTRRIQISVDKYVDVEIINSRLSPKAKFHQHYFSIFISAVLFYLVKSDRFRNWLTSKVPWLKALRQADFIGDIAGGDSFSDIYGIRRFLLTCFGSLTAILLGKKLVLLPQTFGPYTSNVAKRIACFIFSNSTEIYSRDDNGIEIVNKVIGIHHDRVQVKFCPDVAFALPAIKPQYFEYQPPIFKDQKNPLIGININGLLYVGGYTRDNMFGLAINYNGFVSLLIKYILDNTKADVVLIPHEGLSLSENGDRIACESVFRGFTSSYKERLHLLLSNHNQYEIKYLINNCDFFIGSRLHACIASLSQGIPAVALAYSKKFRGVYDILGIGDMVLDARLLDEFTILDKCIKFYNDRVEIRSNIENLIPEVREKLWTSFYVMFGENPLVHETINENGIKTLNCDNFRSVRGY